MRWVPNYLRNRIREISIDEGIACTAGRSSRDSGLPNQRARSFESEAVLGTDRMVTLEATLRAEPI